MDAETTEPTSLEALVGRLWAGGPEGRNRLWDLLAAIEAVAWRRSTGPMPGGCRASSDCWWPRSDSMPRSPNSRIPREDLPPPVGRRMIVRCLANGCDHAALIDQRRYFSNPRDWPREGPSGRFRCVCGSRQARVTYTRHGDAREGPIPAAVLALWF